jgi:hypothetical protein
MTAVEKPKPIAKAKARKKIPKPGREPGWVVCGFDTSMSSLAGAAIAYDKVLGKLKGPKFQTVRWEKDTDYFARIKDAAKSYEIVLDLQMHLGVSMGMDEIFIAQEEPWPMGITTGKTSGFLKQQAEISGAFLGGLVRYGFKNIAQMHSIRWRTMIANDLGITTHFSKWRSAELATMYNCKPADSGKFRSKQWARGQKDFMPGFPDKVPDIPDIIERKEGRVLRPEGSVAKAIQPADEYDALAVAWTFFLELGESEILELPS